MNKQFFISLFEYDKWANLKIAEAFKQSSKPPVKCKTLFHHIAATTDLWFNRVSPGKRLFESLFEETVPETTVELMLKAIDKWIDFLKKDDVDLQTVTKYTNTKGNNYENKLVDILTHLISHNHYHRGQINILLRENGIEPAKTDYIFYMRD